MQLEGKAGLSILEACDAARVSHAGFYRHFDEHLPRQADTELRQQIQQIDKSALRTVATVLGASSLNYIS